jgi:hypothetical protein
MNIAVVASGTVQRSAAVPIVTALLDSVDKKDVTLLLRHPLNGSAKPFEAALAYRVLSRHRHAAIVWCKPDLKHPGRAGTYVRDVHMVESADLVIAFFTPDSLMRGGTGHVVEKAWEQEKPVIAYELDGNHLRWVGSVD